MKKPSLESIARRAGVSAATVSRALHNKKVVNSATHDRVHRIAREMGYVPDARLSRLMSQMRNTASQDLLPIAWLNTCNEKDAWQRYLYHTPFIEGARERARELGYKIEEIWVHEPGMTMKRLSKILYQRGIEGVIVTIPARHLRLNWEHLASITLGGLLVAPKLHLVTPDLNYNLLVALKALRRLGYKRIGICLYQHIDSSSFYTIRATARDIYFSASRKERIPPHFQPHTSYPAEVHAKDMIAWYERYKPEVIVGHDNRLEEWLNAAGYRVPEDVGIAALAVDDDILDWAGIHTRRREIGATAVEILVSQMRNHQFGVPKTPLNILIRGTWQMGRTLKATVAKPGKITKHPASTLARG